MSLCEHRPPTRCRPASSFPCSSLTAIGPRTETAPRAEEAAVVLHFGAGPRATLLEAAGFPHLKFLTQADKSDMGRKSGVRTQRFRKDDASVAIDAEDVHIAIERDRQFVPLIRIVRQTREKPIDRLRKALAACIERWSIERGVAVDAAGVAVALKHGTERSRDRDASLDVDFVGEGGDKAIHPLLEPRSTLRHRRNLPPGFIWDYMGIDGSQRAIGRHRWEIGPMGGRNATAWRAWSAALRAPQRLCRGDGEEKAAKACPPWAAARLPRLSRSYRSRAHREWRSCRAASAPSRRRRNAASRMGDSAPGLPARRSDNRRARGL